MIFFTYKVEACNKICSQFSIKAYSKNPHPSERSLAKYLCSLKALLQVGLFSLVAVSGGGQKTVRISSTQNFGPRKQGPLERYSRDSGVAVEWLRGFRGPLGGGSFFPEAG